MTQFSTSMSGRFLLFMTVISTGMLLSPAASSASSKAPAQPQIFKRLLDCREIADTAVRLACYDEQVKAIAVASENDEVLVLDRDGIRNTRRSLFGFSFPKLPFLESNDSKAEVSSFDDEITAVRSISYGLWQVTLKEGSVWQTIQPMSFGEPSKGLTIHISKAALGSYKASISKWPAVKIKRVS